MRKNIFLYFFISFIALNIVSCKKSPGPGGTSTIKGRIWVRQYKRPGNTTPPFTNLNAFWGYKQTVYIQYGDGTGLNANGGSTNTDYNGYFEFDYMRSGKYTLFIYSDDSLAIAGPPVNYQAPQKAVIVNTEITKRKQTIDVGTMTILTNHP